MYLLSAEDEYHADEHAGEKMGFLRRYQQGFERGFEKLREEYRRALRVALHSPRLFAACFLGFCIFSGLISLVLGRDFFPKVDAGQIRLHMRARTGLRIEETARLVRVKEERPPRWRHAPSFTSQGRLRQQLMNHHPIKQTASRTDEPVVTARRVTRPGGYEGVDVRRSDL